MANLKLTDGTLSFEWQITGLGSPFNSSNYKRVGISTEAASSAGQTDKPGTIIAEEPAPSSGSSINTDTYEKSYAPGEYTFYGWAYSGGRYWYAGSDEVTVKDESINATYTHTEYATSISFNVSNLSKGQYGYCYITEASNNNAIWNRTDENAKNYFKATKDDYSTTITLGGLKPNTKYKVNVGVWTSGGYTSKTLSSSSPTVTTSTPKLSKQSAANNGFTVRLSNTKNVTNNIAFYVKEKETGVMIANPAIVSANNTQNYTDVGFYCIDGYYIHWNTTYEVYAKIGTWQSDTITITTSNFLQSSISIGTVTTTNTTASFTVSGIPAGFWVNIIHKGDVLDSAISSGSSEDVDIYVDGLIPGTEYTLVVQVNTWRTELGNRQKTITITTTSPSFDCEILSTKIIVNAYDLTGERVSFYVYKGWISDESIDRDNNYGYDILLNGFYSTATCVASGLTPGTKYTVSISNDSFVSKDVEVTTLIPTFKVTDVGELTVSLSISGVEQGDDITVFIRTGPNNNSSNQTTCHNVVYGYTGANRYSFSTNSDGVGVAMIDDIYGSTRRIQPGTLHSINVKVNEGGWLNGGGTNGNLSKEFETDPLSTTYTRASKRDSITFNVESIPSPSDVWFYINRVDADGSLIEQVVTSSTKGALIENVTSGSVSTSFSSSNYPNLKQGWYYVANVHIVYDGIRHELGKSIRFGLYERPENWEWESTVQKDALIRIRGEEWNNFTSRINEFRLYSGMEEATFTDAIGGVTKIGATICNQAYDAIYYIEYRGALPTKAVKNTPISASFFNKLMTALNAIP